MRNRIITVFNSLPVESGAFAMVLSLLCGAIAGKYFGLQDVELASYIFAGIILAFVLITATILIAGKSQVKEMDLRARIILENLTRILSVAWIFITTDIVCAAIISILFIWDALRGLRQQMA